MSKFYGLPIKWSKYIPHKPTPKQLAFLALPHREAFFGGAAGGGKSDALLMGALQYVDTPGYASILFRRTFTELEGSEGLISRAKEWLGNTDAVWNGTNHCWTFPTKDPITGQESEPARLEFGYIGESNAHLKYQGRAYQFVGWDELTHQWEHDYLYLFSRLRKTVCPIHKTIGGKPNYQKDCLICRSKKAVPLRVRATSNPGGIGHQWVKDRFSIGPDQDIDIIEAKEKGIKIRYIGHNKDRPFIPSFVTDNPFLAQEEYFDALDELDPITREQLKSGDWGVSADSRFRLKWARYYSKRGNELYVMGKDGRGEVLEYPANFIRTFATVDPAGSSREGPGDTEIWENILESHTVISVWGLTQNYDLLWLDLRRFRKEIPDINRELKQIALKWRPEYFVIETNGLGLGVFQFAQRSGLPVKGTQKNRDKVINATDAILRMEQGKIWLPQYAPWKQECEGELFRWTGHPKEQDDIVDTLSDAAKDVSWEAAETERFDDPILSGYLTSELPYIINQRY